VKRQAISPDAAVTWIRDGKIVHGYWRNVQGYWRNVPVLDLVEGVDFIFGHHADGSEEVAALRAAHRLAPPKAMPLEVASHAFIKGEITEEAFKANLDLWDAEFHTENTARR
jgi:hypothetical protein